MSDQQKKGESAAAAGKKEEENKGEGRIAIEELVSTIVVHSSTVRCLVSHLTIDIDWLRMKKTSN